jgi:isopentenyl-diphosphate delta-isomerase
MEKVILVDNSDNPLGTEEKMKTHELGLLHRAFSVFIFNSKGELMLQQRSLQKYHSPGLWTNTCCSHPRENEPVETAANRRLKEEMGFDCHLKKIFHFIYKADVGKGLIENEFDHVFFGQTDIQPSINPLEVNDWKYMPMNEIRHGLIKNPDQFTVWFKIVFEEVDHHLQRLRSKK